MLTPGAPFGKYQIDRAIGEGGMGMVYLATEKETGEKRALKVLNQQFASSAEYREKLAAEARLNSLVDSPYVVKVLDSSEIDGVPYFAMEYIVGSDLRQGLEEFDFDAKLTLTEKIGRGIDAAHSVGLIHRDLKPENILISEGREPKILDFGLAQEIDPEEVDQEGNIEGTLHYLSPEQLCGEQLTARCDLFSFGTIVYEMFCGRRPFEGEYAASIIYDILHEEPLQPTDVNPSLPEWVNTLTSRLLAKKPDARFESMAAVISFVEQCRLTGVVVGESAAPRRQTVTVIDLKNMSGDAEWSYFCEGFTDDVIRELARRTNLIVSAQPATAFKRNIRETLDICRSEYVVVGSLMKWQEKVKLTLSIHQQEDESLIWSEAYTEPSDGLFDLLSRAAAETSQQLSEASGSEEVAVAEEYKPDVTAYDFYLKGKSYYQTNRPEDLQFAQQMFARALEADPNLALAHAGLSDVYAFEYMAFYDRTLEKIQSAREHAEKAIEIDSKLPDAHRSLARYHMFTGDLAQGEESLKKAIELNPKYAIGYRTLAWLQHAQDNFVLATDWARKALELAPTDLETHLLLGLLAIEQGQYSVAISTLQRAIELGPDYGRAHYYLGIAYSKLGVVSKALEALDAACRHKGDPNSFVDAGYIHLVRNNFEDAERMFRASIENEYFSFVAYYYLGLMNLLKDDIGEATNHFCQALELIEQFDLENAENLPVLVYKAMILGGLGEKDQAAELLDRAEKSEHLSPDIKNNIARGYALIGNADRVLQLYEEIVSVKSGPTKKELDLDPHFMFLGRSHPTGPN